MVNLSYTECSSSLVCGCPSPASKMGWGHRQAVLGMYVKDMRSQSEQEKPCNIATTWQHHSDIEV